MKIETTKIRKPNAATAPRLAEFFGYRIPDHRRKLSFFAEHEGELEWIYHDCRKRYLELAKEAHPDNGGDHESSVAINTAWDRLTHLFSLHCSGIKSPTFIKRAAPKRPRAPYVVTPARKAVLKRMASLPRKVTLTPKRIAASKANALKMLASRGIIPKSERPPTPQTKADQEPAPYKFTPARQAALDKARHVMTPRRAATTKANILKAHAARKAMPYNFTSARQAVAMAHLRKAHAVSRAASEADQQSAAA